MAKLAKNIVDFCTAVEPYAYVMAVVGCLVLGFCFVIPSEKLHKFASSYGPKILIGVGLIAGCVYIGKTIGKQWSFDNGVSGIIVEGGNFPLPLYRSELWGEIERIMNCDWSDS